MGTRQPSPKARLVVVDDDEGLLFLMGDALRREGFEVNGFGSGKAAFDWLAREPADLVLLDLKLNDLPAQSLVERLRERGRVFPFIIITGHGDERVAVEIMKQGALDYVMKESGMLELLPAIVRRALDVAEQERRLAEANAAVRQREERLQGVIQTALDGFVRFDRDWGIIDVNRAICDLLGYTREQMLSITLLDIETVVSPNHLAERKACLEAEGAAHCFTRVRRSDGRLLDVEISMRADQDGSFGFMHDLSEQRRLEREVLQISEDERQRFGHELHDGLGQQLTAIELMSHLLARDLKSKAPALAKSANEIARLTRKTIAQTRHLAHGLAPVALGADGLMAALNDLAQSTSRIGVPCEFHCDTPVSIPDLAAATHLYRIAQEAVNNALKHARARKISVSLGANEHSLELAIEDNGVGLRKSNNRGIGLRVIHHRARLIGAQIHLHSTRGKGVRVVCSLPKQP